jgi:hypothetical protein
MEWAGLRIQCRKARRLCRKQPLNPDARSLILIATIQEFSERFKTTSFFRMPKLSV